ncbi:C40 family peptidase [Niabella insulamsoli]|uniref:C40 family peptidase n=1 Tax=Niabella insulamsoli TaxID=3144874 RepID=UPI0031FD90BF
MNFKTKAAPSEATPLANGPGSAIPQPDTVSRLLKFPAENDSSINVMAVVDFAETLLGVPYLYASSDPAKGFDCSGFITYVFNHFGYQVPRSSVDFTDKGRQVAPANAKRGDLILFTGTDSASLIVGHMGIITDNTDSLRFIHSSSGKANGVTISSMTSHYQARFVKVINIERGL